MQGIHELKRGGNHIPFNMKKITHLILLLSIFSACTEKNYSVKNDVVVANGQMPNIVQDGSKNIDLVYGSGDSIMYAYSTDKANTFSEPALISVLPHAYSYATRGPQIAATAKGLIVTAATSAGDIFSFYKELGETWIPGKKVNDQDSVAKEGLTSLSADGDNVWAIWLDLRGNRRNKIYGANSHDGGKTWSANRMIYISPDTSVCECCKPSVIVKGSNVFVMFRNWLDGNRDIYLIRSTDNGNTFEAPDKLGRGSWKLNGCPMDGGGLTAGKNGEIQTVWRREGKIYAATPGMPENEIGRGRSCTMETVNGKNVYAWTENGEVVIIKPKGRKVILGNGVQPVLKALNNGHILCVWENEKQIHASVLEL